MSVAPENDLERALLETHMSGASPAAVLAPLRDAVLFIPRPPTAGHSGEQTLELPVLESEGARYVPAFSSLRQLQRLGPPDSAHIEVPAAVLARAWPAHHSLALNPGDEATLTIPPEAVADIAPTAESETPPGTTVSVGEPAPEPEAQLARFRQFAQARPTIAAAYRCIAVIPNESAGPELVIGLLFAGEPSAKVLREAAALGGLGVAVTAINPAAPDAVARFMLECTEPFYRSAGA